MEVPVAVADYGWHTGLIVPAKALGTVLTGLHGHFRHARYLGFGWGNRRFYESSKQGLGLALRSILPSSSVVLLQGFGSRLRAGEEAGATLHWLCVSRSGVRRLDRFLADYFRKGPHGHFIGVEPGMLPHSEFFASTGTYDAFHTCNTWTAEALHAAGLPVNSHGIVFAGQLLTEIRPLWLTAGPAAANRPRSKPQHDERRSGASGKR